MRAGPERRLRIEDLMLSNCGAEEDSLRVPSTERRSNQSILKETNADYSWEDWCQRWSSNTLATWCEELTCWKRPWWWERLRVGGEGSDRGWDGWMASSTQWTSLSKLWEIVKDREARHAVVHGVTKSQTWLKRLNNNNKVIKFKWDFAFNQYCNWDVGYNFSFSKYYKIT